VSWSTLRFIISLKQSGAIDLQQSVWFRAHQNNKWRLSSGVTRRPLELNRTKLWISDCDVHEMFTHVTLVTWASKPESEWWRRTLVSSWLWSHVDSQVLTDVFGTMLCLSSTWLLTTLCHIHSDANLHFVTQNCIIIRSHLILSSPQELENLKDCTFTRYSVHNLPLPRFVYCYQHIKINTISHIRL
jgi:hypothetical protein